MPSKTRFPWPFPRPTARPPSPQQPSLCHDSTPPALPPYSSGLLRNFSLVSLTGFLLTTGLLAGFYRQTAVNDLVMVTEESNVLLTQLLSNTLRSQYSPFLFSASRLSKEAIVREPKIIRLREDILEQVRDLSIVKVKIYSLEGRVIFSTDFDEIGVDKSGAVDFNTAKQGDVFSELEQLERCNRLGSEQGQTCDRYILASYIPVYADDSSRQIIGVFELYADTTPAFRHIGQTQRNIVLGSLGILAVLYTVLYFFVRRADRLIHQQYQQLQASEQRYQQQTEQLEAVLMSLKQAQAQIIQTEKMSSLGQLMAGMAHEINNPVGFIYGNIKHVKSYAQQLFGLIQLYQRHYAHPPDEIQAMIRDIDVDFMRDDLPKMLASMELGSNRIRDIVLALRIFSRLDESDLKAVDLHSGIDSVLLILHHRLDATATRSEIEVVRDYGDLPLVECHSRLLNQVFMHLINNAIDAIDGVFQTGEGAAIAQHRITIRTMVQDANHVKVAIANTGGPIPDPVQQHMIEPFFTTKPVGKGRGLGLSNSYQIITTRHGGTFSHGVDAQQNTEFVFTIPIQPTA